MIPPCSFPSVSLLHSTSIVLRIVRRSLVPKLIKLGGEAIATRVVRVEINIAKRKHFVSTFERDWSNFWPCIQPVRGHPDKVLCTVCNATFGIAHQGRRDVERRMGATEHKRLARIVNSCQSLSSQTDHRKRRSRMPRSSLQATFWNTIYHCMCDHYIVYDYICPVLVRTFESDQHLLSGNLGPMYISNGFGSMCTCMCCLEEAVYGRCSSLSLGNCMATCPVGYNPPFEQWVNKVLFLGAEINE